ncbi:MAG TPA: alpha-L-fucosidase [Verrucomicrobiota bacterium]|nr:alpha-L-fucosidase [Verrucomicrobiota bacterium]HNU51013.1 alpha-L-fucosidase [Verrucomicrobiota bacterium]
MKTLSKAMAVAMLILMSGGLRAADAVRDYTQESPAERDARMAWFREARFGLFIHWGLYAVPAGEWKDNRNYGEWFLEETKMPVSQYAAFVPQFNPVRFDARQWARAAREAGMRYVVITSKHHDGFALWRSGLTDWGIKSTPFARDPMKELAEACRAEGLRFCFYHSIMDWHHPDWGTRRAWNDLATGTPDMDRYVTYMKGQLRELITGYGPLGILWFDGEWESPWTHERGVDLYNFVRSLQPSIIINNRVGKGRAGMGGMDQGKGVGDYGTPEQEIPPTGFGPGVDWESCMTMNNHWGYNRHDQNWKSTSTLVRNLIDCASKGGNYLLNVGPTAEGTFPEASVQRLAEIGAWMKVNGESIYGTTASPFPKSPWGRATQKAGRLYLHVYQWPADGRLSLPLRNAATAARLLAQPEVRIGIKRQPESLELTLPASSPDPIAAVIALDVVGAPDVVAVLPAQAADGSLALKAEEAALAGHGARIEHKNGIANLGYWVDPRETAAWTVRVDRPGTFVVSAEYALAPGSDGSRVRIECGANRLESQLKSTGGWDQFQTVALGELRVEGKGPQSFKLVPVAKPGEGVMNLRSLRLTLKP